MIYYQDREFLGSNPYYYPEKCGLTIVAEIELEVQDYSYNTIVVWKHESGRLFSAHDSGCSCPTPFENFCRLSDLTELTPYALNELRNTIYTHEDVTPQAAQEFLYKVKAALSNAKESVK